MKNQITFRQVGYGQWTASTMYYGKEILMHFTDSKTFDLIKSKERAFKKASKNLHSKIISNHKSI